MVDKAAMPGVAAMVIVDRLRALSRPRALGRVHAISPPSAGSTRPPNPSPPLAIAAGPR